MAGPPQWLVAGPLLFVRHCLEQYAGGFRVHSIHQERR